MPRRSPYVIDLTKGERAELEARSRDYTSPYRDVVRAKIVLLASQGLGNDRIAARLDMPRQIVSKWRRRFYSHRLSGLDEQPRGGRPARFSPQVSWLRSRRWLVSCRVVEACRYLAGQSPNCVRRRCRAASSHRSVARHFGAGSARTRCGRGVIAPGFSRAIRSSLARPGTFSTFTNAVGKVQHWGHAITFSPLTRRPASRPGSANIRHCRPPRDVRSTLSTNTRVPARWPTSSPGTCIAPNCSAAASARTASLRSSALSHRSWAGNLTVPRVACSSSPTTAPLIAANEPLHDCAPNGRTSSWSTRRSMPADSTRLRSTSPSFSASSSRRATSPISLPSSTV
jgi:transposase-like protein